MTEPRESRSLCCIRNTLAWLLYAAVLIVAVFLVVVAVKFMAHYSDEIVKAVLGWIK